MKYEHMFICLIVPGLDNPGPQLNVMLQSLIEELKQLWVGVEAYDYHKKQKFNLRAAYLWSIHDFLAYGIFSGWCIHRNLTCPICGKDTDCFRLEFRRRYVILIVIDVFFLWTTPLGCKVMLRERILLWKRDHRGIEPVKRLFRN
jgi:hypothetical protein